ncbi:unnamed protein product [Allacma fusca]|uniref:Pre-mRNA-splicing factor SLU7 n=1 Tax=Allacma fusca TaxID=39272 RepID=A0A8J2LGA5_9HEXA|nr:unnamed protein product [Allacma fusca]
MATRFRKGACENCGALTHKRKDCMERPRRVEARLTGDAIAPDKWIMMGNETGGMDIPEEDEDKYVDDVEMPGTKVDSKQRITVRNLRIREDVAKYFHNESRAMGSFELQIYIEVCPQCKTN